MRNLVMQRRREASDKPAIYRNVRWSVERFNGNVAQGTEYEISLGTAEYRNDWQAFGKTQSASELPRPAGKRVVCGRLRQQDDLQHDLAPPGIVLEHGPAHVQRRGRPHAVWSDTLRLLATLLHS